MHPSVTGSLRTAALLAPWLLTATLPAAAAPPPHETLLEALRASDAVLPPTLKEHPATVMYNAEAVVPSQCYTRTEARSNPCYVCHQDAIEDRENVMNDADLQQAYSFSDVGMTNHWRNLFEDRSARAARISDAEILAYIAGDNYSELSGRLREAGFQGYVPDLQNLQLGAAAFDEQGFARDGSQWVAFNYKPLPSTFWPTNGSTDDILIRLPAPYRSDAEGRPSREVYKANLAILEARIKGLREIGCLPVDEAAIGRDLDGDGRLDTVRRIVDPRAWAGAAEGLYFETHLYPEGTEFLHSVRYVGIGADGTIGVSTRLKELRYMRKVKAYSKLMYARKYQTEGHEKELGHLPGYVDIGHHGLDNGNGWAVQGFIENRRGRLRALTHEENFSCMGCHNAVGSTIDKTFGFPRKVDGAEGWGYIQLRGMPDAPSMGETRGEIETYFERVAGGSEFRNNDEMAARWFQADGTLNPEKFARARDVYDLITPSPERALALNKAYRVIVEDQDFIYGKDAVLTPPANVYDKIDNATAPTLPPERVYRYDLRLAWPKTAP